MYACIRMSKFSWIGAFGGAIVQKSWSRLQYIPTICSDTISFAHMSVCPLASPNNNCVDIIIIGDWTQFHTIYYSAYSTIYIKKDTDRGVIIKNNFILKFLFRFPWFLFGLQECCKFKGSLTSKQFHVIFFSYFLFLNRIF